MLQKEICYFHRLQYETSPLSQEANAEHAQIRYFAGDNTNVVPLMFTSLFFTRASSYGTPSLGSFML